MLTTKENIDKFIANKKIAVVGASSKRNNFGKEVIKDLQKRGYEPIPVHPEAPNFFGLSCVKTIKELPKDVQAIHISTSKKFTASIVKEALEHGIKSIWIQQMSETEEAIKLTDKSDVNLIYGECIFMFAEPVGGIHKFHRSIKKLFGALPK
jgi:uncharacterized protein